MIRDFPEDTLPSMALWLARHIDRVRRHEAAAVIVAEVTAAVRQAVRAIDRPPQRVYAGPCPACGTDLLTWPGHTHVTCGGCGATHEIAERQDAMRNQLDDYLGTATYAAAILPGIGIHVSAGTIRVWASRHRLQVRVTVPPRDKWAVEQHLYRLGDIIDLALERDTRAGLAVAAIVIQGDARQIPLPDASVDLLVTSPPYFGLRSYVDAGQHYESQIGSEATPQEWVAALIECTAEWARVLKPAGSMFVNLGDKYVADNRGSGVDVKRGQAKHAPRGPAGYVGRDMARHKSLLGLPWRYALACTDQLGLILRRDIIWAKPNGLPESVTDRCRSSHEYLFHLVKQPRYYAAVDEIREAHTGNAHASGPRATHQKWISGNGAEHRKAHTDPDQFNALGKLPGSVWNIPSQPLTVPPHLGIDHFAAFPMELPRRCVLGWSPPGICVECGEGRRPVAEVEHEQRTSLRQLSSTFTGRKATDVPQAVSGRRRPQDMPGGRQFRWNTITGYACACPTPDAPTRPAVVLDPFGGTGTTALVASMHGRTGVSIDRSADYTRLAHWRTNDPAERAKALQVPKPPPVPDGMDALF